MYAELVNYNGVEEEPGRGDVYVGEPREHRRDRMKEGEEVLQ